MLRLAMIVIAWSVSFALAQQPVTSPIYYLSNAPEVRVGAAVAGTLTRESGRNFKDGAYLDVAVLRGREGQAIDLRATSLEFDTYLTLYAPDGSVLAANDDDERGQAGTDSAIRATLPVTGTYVVVVSGYGVDDLGAYMLTLEHVGMAGSPTPAETDLALGSAVEGTLVQGGVSRYTITVDEPTVVGIELRSSWFDTYLEVQDADGWTMAENDDMVGTTDSGVIVWLDVGTYEVLVSAFGSTGNGPYTLTIDRYVRTP